MKNDFFNYIEYQKRYSSHTITSYKNDLHQFERYLGDSYDECLETATYPMIRSWVVHLIENAYHITSIHRKISCVKAFYNFLNKENKIKGNPARNIKLPKSPKKLPFFFCSSKTTSIKITYYIILFSEICKKGS